MVVTTVCGAMIGYNLYLDVPTEWSGVGKVSQGLEGGVIGAVVAVPIWIWLGVMICR